MLGLAALAAVCANADPDSDPGRGYRGGRYYGRSGYRRGYGRNYYGYGYKNRYRYAAGGYKKAPYYAAKPLPHPEPVPVPIDAPVAVAVEEPLSLAHPIAPIDDHAPLVIKELPARRGYSGGYGYKPLPPPPVHPVPHVIEEHVVPAPPPPVVEEVVHHAPAPAVVHKTVTQEQQLVGHVVHETVRPVEAVPAIPVQPLAPVEVQAQAQRFATVDPTLPPFGSRIVAQEAPGVVPAAAPEPVPVAVDVRGFPAQQQVLLQPQPQVQVQPVFAQEPRQVFVQQAAGAPVLPPPVPAVPDQPVQVVF